MRPAILNPLFEPIANVHGLGPKFAPLVAGLATGGRVIDLLTKLTPKKMVERQVVPHLKNLNPALVGQYVVVQGKIMHHAPPENSFKKNRPYKIYLADGVCTLTLTFFLGGGTWLKRQYPPGAQMTIGGVLNQFQGEWQITHPDLAMVGGRLDTIAKTESLYPTSHNLPQKVIQKSIQSALTNSLRALPPLPEWLPPAVMEKYHLPSWADAIRQIHHPTTPADLTPQSPARQRLAMDEILAWQIAIKQARAAARPLTEPRPWLLPNPQLFGQLTLPFALTRDQQTALGDIERDLSSLKKMTRLLMGDVGSGKTIVGFYALLRAVEKSILNPAATNGQAPTQSALLAPTEILAEQHYHNLRQLIGPLNEKLAQNKMGGDIKITLLTGGLPKKEKEARRAMIKNGDCHIVIGTHALIQEEVAFANLRLLVIDEQQRFGVLQRFALYQKSFAPTAPTAQTETANGQNKDQTPNQPIAPPDLLLMTATPIPRTLSLIQFGDLDLSTLQEKPAGRQVIQTAMISDDRLAEVIARLKKQMAMGASVFWVCPLIEDSEALPLPSAEARFELAKNYFSPNEMALIHGQMRSADKQKIIDDFKSGRVKLLIATTVIESGIDIPRATIILIDHAEYFGLTQLHQLRGRVGRDQILGGDGPGQAYCLLLYHPPLSETAKKRLGAVKDHNDGFYLAEKDLEWRGMGDRYGLRQSGFGDFHNFDIFFHHDILLTASQLAEQIIAENKLAEAPYQTLLALYQKDHAVELVRAG